MDSVHRTRFLDRALILLAVTAVYMIAGKIGLSLASVNKSATAVWPPTGIALAAFLLLGYRVWPGVLLGAFLVNITTAGNTLTSLGIAAGNTLEGLLGCHLVRRFAGGERVFEQPSSIFRFAFLAGVLATAVSATIGVTTLSLGGFARWSDFGAIWITWWLGDGAGALVVTPLVVLWWRDPHVSWHAWRKAEFAVLLAVVVTLALFVFSGASPIHANRFPIQYLCLPPLLWTAFRFGSRESATVIALLSAIAIHGTLGGFGPFAAWPTNDSLLLLQAFMAVLSITVLATAATAASLHKIERSVRQLNQELEHRVAERTEANRLKDEFLATLSHELRTPLNAIVGWASLLKEGKLDSATTVRAVETINRNVKIQSHLISDILDISRMAAGQLDIKKQPVSLTTVLEGGVDTMGPMARARNVRLERSLSHPTHPVLGDPDRLQQVVWNLLSNAIKFTPEGGRVMIHLNQEGSQARIRVEDDGPGIDPEFLPYVFERFRQRDSSGTRKHGGLGLGLAIVRHIVELHGGRVSASNRPEGGAAFTVTLPLAEIPPLHRARASGSDGPAVAEPGRDPVVKPLGGTRILLVEDDQDSRELIAMFLAKCGAEVEAVSNSRDALSSLSSSRPDVLVSDIAMPGESGYDLIEKVRSLPRTSGGSTPAIALTAYAGTEDVGRAIQAGFDVHMAKPVEMKDLVRTVRDLVDGRRENQ